MLNNYMWSCIAFKTFCSHGWMIFTKNTGRHGLLGSFEQRMIGTDQLSQVQRYVGDLVTEQPSETEERRWITDDFLGFGHGAVPVGLLLVAVTVHGGGRRGVRPPVADDGGGRLRCGHRRIAARLPQAVP